MLEKLLGRLRRPIPPVNHSTVDQALLLLDEFKRRGTEAVRSDPDFRQRLERITTRLTPLIELREHFEFTDKASQLIEDYEKQGAQTISQDQSFRRKLEDLLDFLSKSRSAKIVNSSQADKLKKISRILELVDKAIQLSEKYLTEGEDAIKEDRSLLEEFYNITERSKLYGFVYAQFGATDIGKIIKGIQEKLSPVRRALWLIGAHALSKEKSVSDQGIYSHESIQKEIVDIINEPVLEGTQVRDELERTLTQMEQSHVSS